MFGPAPADDLLAFLAEEGHVRQAGDGRWYWSSENFPASEISLRTAAPENVVIIDTTPDRPRVLGEVDLFSAQVLVHERAIYIHESIQYYVDRLEWHERKAYVHKIDADHYTYANRAVTLKPLEVFAEAPATGGHRKHGEVMVASLVTLFKKLKFVTDENVGWGPIDLPELELQTTAYWLTADRARDHWRRDELDVALLGAGRAIQTIASVLLMVDPRDLGLVTQVRSPHAEEPTIYLYEAVPGRDRPVGAAVAAPRRAAGRRRGPDRGVRLRRRLSGLHRAAPRAERRRPPTRAAPARGAGRPRRHGRRPTRRRRMIDTLVEPADRLARRLARFRAANPGPGTDRRSPALPPQREPRPGTPAGRRGRRRGRRCPAAGSMSASSPRAIELPLDRDRLAALPGQPPADRPLVCLDTETTGLATAAGTVAFLIGLGWWAGDRSSGRSSCCCRTTGRRACCSTSSAATSRAMPGS